MFDRPAGWLQVRQVARPRLTAIKRRVDTMRKPSCVLGLSLLLMALPALASENPGATGTSSMGINSAGTTATGPKASFGLEGAPTGGPRTYGQSPADVNPPPAVEQAQRDAMAGVANAGSRAATKQPGKGGAK